MPLVIDMAIATTHKYASRESGDSADIIARPDGGVTLILVDGQGSGRGARDISHMLVSTAAGMVRDGVRDGVVARALNDILRTHRRGQVSATLDMVSVDLSVGEIIITRQGGATGIFRQANDIEVLPAQPVPLGRPGATRPGIWQYPAEDGVLVIVTTDGIGQSGVRRGDERFDLGAFACAVDDGLDAASVADAVLEAAIQRDDRRPGDDLSVGVLRIREQAMPMPVSRFRVQQPIERTPI